MKRGFTLLELMVVLIIIGFLATLGGANYVTSLRRGRNARRIEDLKAVAEAQEQYFGEEGDYADISGCVEADLITVTNAIPEMPEDPNSFDYECNMNGTSAFCLRAELEDPFNGANCASCDCGTGTDCSIEPATAPATNDSFCVKNLQ